jgi:general secretion pathway protein L
MAQLTVGLDLGHESIKRIRLKSSFRNVEIVDFVDVPLTDDDRPRSQRLGEALQQLSEESRPSDLVATALPGNEVSTRLLTLPFTDRKKVAQIIGLELERQIPFSLDKIVFDYLPADQSSNEGSQLLVAYCQIERMAEWLAILGSGEFDPRLVGLDNLAYTTLAEHLPAPSENATVAIIDIGHRLTSICIMGPAGVQFARTISLGGYEITNKLAETFGVDFSQAEDGKQRGGYIGSKEQESLSPEQEKISNTIQLVSSVLVRGLKQSFSAYNSIFKKSLDKIWLCGGGASIANFDNYLASELEVDVEYIRTEHFDIPGIERLSIGNDNSNRWAKPLGLALHAHQAGRRNWLNLRRGPFAHKGEFEYVKTKLVHMGVVVLIILLLATGTAITKHLSLSSTDRALNKRIKESTRAILGQAEPDIEKALAIIKEKLSPESDPLPQTTALDIFREIHSYIPGEMTLKLRDINISPKKIQLAGFTDSFESVEKIKLELEKYKCFTEIRTGKVQKTQDDEVEFGLTIVFGC